MLRQFSKNKLALNVQRVEELTIHPSLRQIIERHCMFLQLYQNKAVFASMNIEKLSVNIVMIHDFIQKFQIMPCHAT